MTKRKIPVAIISLSIAFNAGLLSGQDSVVAKLLSPISTKTSKIGDRFTALVENPANLNGGTLEGQITKLKAPARGIGKGKPQIEFQFETLTMGGKTTNIRGDLTDVANSKGVRSVDEEGRVIGRTSNGKRALFTALAAGAGAAIGGATNGGKGAAQGAAIGGAAGLLISVSMTSTGSDLEFYPGSQFTIRLSPRSR